MKRKDEILLKCPKIQGKNKNQIRILEIQIKMLYFLQKSNVVNFQGCSKGFKSASAPSNGNYSKIILDEVKLFIFPKIF